jgi:hypothetical protein
VIARISLISYFTPFFYLMLGSGTRRQQNWKWMNDAGYDLCGGSRKARDTDQADEDNIVAS